MNFDLVLRQLLEGFERLKIRYASIGGFALGAVGFQRATNDLDFLVHKDDLMVLHDLMTALGYERVHQTENVSQYRGQTVVWGHVDFIHAFRPLALKILADAVPVPVFSGERVIRVARAEDILGLKVQALANNPDRKSRELADIEALLKARPGIDWERLGAYFSLFKLTAEFEDLKRRLKRA